MGNPAEETYCYPNSAILCPGQHLSTDYVTVFFAGVEALWRSHLGQGTNGTPPQSGHLPVAVVNWASHRGQ